MNKKLVILDVDDVLRDWDSTSRKVISEFTDIPKEVLDPRKQPDNFHWITSLPNEYLNKCLDALFSPDFPSLILHKMAPELPWAQKLYSFLKYNFEVKICSTQKSLFLEELTENWLYKNINGFDSEISFVKNHDDKATIEGDIIIDDRIETLNLIYDKKLMHTYCLKRPWNMNGDVNRCDFVGTADEIIDELSMEYLT
jgi:5'(3')-deoxyribonucleotidase